MSCIVAGAVDGRSLKPPIWWAAGSPGTRKRKAPARAVVHHWTGGTGGAQAVAHTLRTRKSRKTGKPEPLSIHFIVEPSGRVVQCADLDTVTLHAGAANEWSIGVEIVGGPKSDFTAEQYAAIAALAEALPVPRVVFAKGDDLATFKGHLEHLYLTARKIDAGERVMRFLAARWGQRLSPA